MAKNQPTPSTPAPAASTEAPAPDAPKKERRQIARFLARLRAGDEEVRCFAAERANKFVSYVQHIKRDATTKKVVENKRGATENHESFEAAKARANEIADKLAAMGWKRRITSGGFKKTDDFTFDSLPAPVV